MPANLTPEYLAAEREYKNAQSHAERIAALERMLATLPKHKGTEKMQADLRRRLSQARKESQKKGPAHAAPFYVVEKEGAGQVVLIGPPNAGKSQLVAALTRAEPEVADYPFTTRFPTPGMMLFEDVQIQLVDLPPISAEFMEPWIPQVIRNADLGVLLMDVNDVALLDQIEFIEQTLERHRLARPQLLAANKIDLPGAEANLAALQDLYGERYRYIGISAAEGHNLDLFARAVFDALGLVRVYTKAPGKKADLTAPYVLQRGQTVLDAARMVHQDFAQNLKFARLYRTDGNRDGIMVERTYVVEDRDILEFHM
ncbi:MAG TPA: 50S ribosome-binding GTPase [Bryobacteraceae bacterium]|nr:50S ribosome-binding GTPase [Bryobacteraceae bacterium]HPU72428.1 50S ribosome-binding GTPase [Bryobacteraceae bacterium]